MTDSVCTVVLPPSKTYPIRHATFVRVRPDAVIGVLEIRERRVEGGKATVSRYAVREERPVGNERVFRLTKPGGDAKYFVLLAADSGRYHQCECHGFASKGTCKHVQAMAALRAKGVLEIVPD